MKLYSYVVQHDYGHAPNPYFGACTLARCKKKIVERAVVGDWIVGTGGADKRKSAGNGNLIYAMKVEKKMTLGQYWSDPKFKDKKVLKDGEYAQQRGDNKKPKSVFEEHERFVLLSRNQYYYFGKEAGKKALKIPSQFRLIEKKGPGYKVKFDPQFVGQFLTWLKSKYKAGTRGDPWGKEFKSSKEKRKREACKSSC